MNLGKTLKSMLVMALLSGLIFSLPVNATQVIKTNQDVTAYVSEPGKLTADETTPYWGVVAVHSTSGCCTPVYPFGTTVYTSGYIVSEVGEGDLFYIHDTGPGPGKTTHWIDVWFKSKHFNQYNCST